MLLTERKQRSPATNSTSKKLAVQWLNEVLCFMSTSVLAESFVLRNRQLLRNIGTVMGGERRGEHTMFRIHLQSAAAEKIYEKEARPPLN